MRGADEVRDADESGYEETHESSDDERSDRPPRLHGVSVRLAAGAALTYEQPTPAVSASSPFTALISISVRQPITVSPTAHVEPASLLR